MGYIFFTILYLYIVFLSMGCGLKIKFYYYYYICRQIVHQTNDPLQSFLVLRGRHLIHILSRSVGYPDHSLIGFGGRLKYIRSRGLFLPVYYCLSSIIYFLPAVRFIFPAAFILKSNGVTLVSTTIICRTLSRRVI